MLTSSKQHINSPELNTLSSITTALQIYSSEMTGLPLCTVWTSLVYCLNSSNPASAFPINGERATIKRDNRVNYFLALAWHHRETPSYNDFKSKQQSQQKINKCSCFSFVQVHAIFYTLLNENRLISEITRKLGRIRRLLRNWFGIPSLVTDTMTACIYSCCRRDTHASACKCTSSLERWTE